MKLSAGGRSDNTMPAKKKTNEYEASFYGKQTRTQSFDVLLVDDDSDSSSSDVELQDTSSDETTSGLAIKSAYKLINSTSTINH